MSVYKFSTAVAISVLSILGLLVLPSFKPVIDHQTNNIAGAVESKTQQKTDISESNRLYINSIAVDMKIFEGVQESTLDKGLWRRPHTSAPDLGSNTVIAGHRLAPIGQSKSLYNLDKVKLDDIIRIDWNGQRYTYKVDEITTVSPDEISVEKPTVDSRLTIYTCTPLFVYTERLVVGASLVDTTATHYNAGPS